MKAEGIIQKACEEMMMEYLKYDDEMYFEANDIAMKIAKLEADLIVKIKKIPIEDYFEHYQPHHHSCNSKCNLSIIRTLIGEE